MLIPYIVDENTPVDLDASIICFDKFGDHVETIYYDRKVFSDPNNRPIVTYQFKIKESVNGSIVHSGDNESGEGDGDDEQIFLQLDRVDAKISEMFCIVTIYSPAFSFAAVRNVFCRILDMSNTTKREVCRYNLTQCRNTSAQVMCKLMRTDGQWKSTFPCPLKFFPFCFIFYFFSSSTFPLVLNVFSSLSSSLFSFAFFLCVYFLSFSSLSLSLFLLFSLSFFFSFPLFMISCPLLMFVKSF